MPLRTVALFSRGKVNLGMIDGLRSTFSAAGPVPRWVARAVSTGRALRSLVARATG